MLKVFDIVCTGGQYVLRRPDATAAIYESTAALAYELFFEIVRLAHPDLDPMACLHASLVRYGTGPVHSAVAFIANSGGGKSTLAAALASAGWSILSDDRLFLDFPTCLPAATPNTIGLKQGSWAPLLSRYPAIAQLPIIRSEGREVRYLLPSPPTERLLPPVRHLFFPSYHAAAATTAIPLTTVQALERIAASESWISSDPGKLASFLQWTDGLGCYDLPYSSLDAAIEQIEERLRA